MRFAALLQVLLSTFVFAQKIAVSKDLQSKFVRYAHFSSAAYSPWCKIPPYGTAPQKKFNIMATSAQAYLFRDDMAKEFILSFRGTSGILDVIMDLDLERVDCTPSVGPACQNCTCHSGFTKQFMSIKDEIYTALNASLAARPDHTLTITGHSLGGALASMMGTMLRAEGRTLDVFTYGQPRTGNQAYADYVDSLFSADPGAPGAQNIMARSTHDDDGIPQVPLESEGGYRHHSTEFWIPPMDGSEAESVLQCAGQEPMDCNQRALGYPLNAAHFSYYGVSTGDIVNKQAYCRGFPPQWPWNQPAGDKQVN